MWQALGKLTVVLKRMAAERIWANPSGSVKTKLKTMGLPEPPEGVTDTGWGLLGPATMTVAVPEPELVLSAAIAVTVWVPVGVPAGTDLVKMTEADCCGASVTLDEENTVPQPLGCGDERIKVLGEEQAAVSLFRTTTE